MLADTKALAEGYMAAGTTQYAAGLFLVDILNITPGLQILDVGCGPGNLTAHLAKVVGATGRVVGVDPSEERIQIARDTYQTTANLSFHVGRAEALSQLPEVHPGTFDVVFVNSTLHWVSDQPRALKEFARVLKAGGKVGISGQDGAFEAVHERIKAAVLARDPYRNYLQQAAGDEPKFLTREELGQMLDDAGFLGAPSRDMIVNTMVRHAKDGYEMVDWLASSSSGKTYGNVPVDLQPNVREEMNREWEKEMGTDGINMKLDLLVTVATKA